MKKKIPFKERIALRAIECGEHIAKTGDTIRGTAVIVNFSKSTVHKDIRDRLPYINKRLYNKVVKILAKNLAERNIRGGEATKKKYAEMNKA